MSDRTTTADDTASLNERRAWLIILVVAAVLRLAQLNAQSLSMDEVKDIATARGGWTSIVTAENRFPPLYHTLLWAWLHAVPWDADGRGFSVLCGVLTVVAVGRLGRVVGGGQTELWAAAFTAVAPLAVWYSVEVRAYSLYLLFGAVALWKFTAALVDGRRRDWAAFAVAALAGVYTHYYFGLLIAVAGLVFLASKPGRAQLAMELITFTLIGAGCLPALAMLRGDLDQPWGFARTSTFSLGGLAYTDYSYVAGYALGPSVRELHILSDRAAATAAAPWLALLGVPTLILLVQASRALAPSERCRWITWFIAFGLVPAAAIGVLSRLAGFGYNVRHSTWAAAAVWVMLAHGVAHGKPRRLAWSMAALLGIGLAIANFNRVYSDAHRNEDVRAAAEFLAAQTTTRPTLVITGYMGKPLARYLPADWPVIEVPAAGSDDAVAKLALDAVGVSVPSGTPFWLVYTREFHGDPKGDALRALQETYKLIREQEFAGIVLYAGERK